MPLMRATEDGLSVDLSWAEARDLLRAVELAAMTYADDRDRMAGAGESIDAMDADRMATVCEGLVQALEDAGTPQI